MLCDACRASLHLRSASVPQSDSEVPQSEPDSLIEVPTWRKEPSGSVARLLSPCPPLLHPASTRGRSRTPPQRAVGSLRKNPDEAHQTDAEDTTRSRRVRHLIERGSKGDARDASHLVEQSVRSGSRLGRTLSGIGNGFMSGPDGGVPCIETYRSRQAVWRSARFSPACGSYAPQCAPAKKGTWMSAPLPHPHEQRKQGILSLRCCFC